MLKLASREITDIYVFDEYGSKVAVLDTLKEAKFINSETPALIYVKDAMLNPDLMKFLSKSEESSRTSDYDKLLSKGTEYKTYVFGNTKKKCKIVAFTYFRDEDSVDRKAYYEFPNVLVGTSIDYVLNGIDPMPTDLMFEVQPFNEDGDTYKLHIEERDYLFTKEELQKEVTALKRELETIRNTKSVVIKSPGIIVNDPFDPDSVNNYISMSVE